MKNSWLKTILSISLIGLTIGASADTKALFPGDVSTLFQTQKEMGDLLPESVLQLGQGYSFPNYAFIVDKTVRSLSLWQKNGKRLERVGHYPADIGKKWGDKKVLGDHRTPEGIYFMIDQYKGKSLDYEKYGSLAFVTNYPNLFDRRERKTGSGIWLHAVPDKTPLTRGSRGCVVVRDDIIQSLIPYVDINKTVIIIKDKENYLTPESWLAQKQELKTWLSEWRQNWQNRQLDRYIDNYSKSFYSLKMGFEQWRWYKKEVYKKNRNIQVHISEPVVYRHKDELIVRFLQKYSSDNVSDFGRKTLYVKKENGQFKIIAEYWKEENFDTLPKEVADTFLASISSL